VGGADNLIQVHSIATPKYQDRMPVRRTVVQYQLLLENSKYSIGDLHCGDARAFSELGSLWAVSWMKWAPAGTLAGLNRTNPFFGHGGSVRHNRSSITQATQLNMSRYSTQIDKRSIPIFTQTTFVASSAAIVTLSPRIFRIRGDIHLPCPR